MNDEHYDAPDPLPEYMAAVTDMSEGEGWKLGMAFAAPPLLPDPERDYTIGVMSTFGTERVTFQVPVVTRVGRHSKTEQHTVTVYRTRKPDGQNRRES